MKVAQKDKYTTGFYLLNFPQANNFITVIFVDMNTFRFYKMGEQGGHEFSKILNWINENKAELYRIDPPNNKTHMKTDPIKNEFYWVEFKEGIKPQNVENISRVHTVIFVKDNKVSIVNQEDAETKHLLHQNLIDALDIIGEVKFPKELKNDG